MSHFDYESFLLRLRVAVQPEVSPVLTARSGQSPAELLVHSSSDIEAIKTQRKARNAPSRGGWVPWAVSLWHKRIWELEWTSLPVCPHPVSHGVLEPVQIPQPPDMELPYVLENCQECSLELMWGSYAQWTVFCPLDTRYSDAAAASSFLPQSSYFPEFLCGHKGCFHARKESIIGGTMS